jgi:hypothetical protein
MTIHSTAAAKARRTGACTITANSNPTAAPTQAPRNLPAADGTTTAPQ